MTSHGSTWLEAVRAEVAEHFVVGKVFSLAEFYQRSEARLQARYPNNTTIQASARNVLQKLRDEGTLEFTDGRGHYRRLR